MRNWTYFATYQVSRTDTRALPASFSELFIVNSSHGSSILNVNFLIPRVLLPDVGTIDLVDPGYGPFNVLQIGTGGMVLYHITSEGLPGDGYYDVYYR